MHKNWFYGYAAAEHSCVMSVKDNNIYERSPSSWNTVMLIDCNWCSLAFVVNSLFHHLQSKEFFKKEFKVTAPEQSGPIKKTKTDKSSSKSEKRCDPFYILPHSVTWETDEMGCFSVITLRQQLFIISSLILFFFSFAGRCPLIWITADKSTVRWRQRSVSVLLRMLWICGVMTLHVVSNANATEPYLMTTEYISLFARVHALHIMHLSWNF